MPSDHNLAAIEALAGLLFFIWWIFFAYFLIKWAVRDGIIAAQRKTRMLEEKAGEPIERIARPQLPRRGASGPKEEQSRRA